MQRATPITGVALFLRTRKLNLASRERVHSHTCPRYSLCAGRTFCVLSNLLDATTAHP